MPKVTVVTGYYNRKDVLRPTITSILSQTFRDLELIVFDDASTDGSGEALSALAAELNDPRLKIRIHETNLGFTQGMVDAIADSSSDYIAVQGSGDISLPERIEKQVAVLDERPDVGAVGCWYTNVVEGSEIRRPRQPNAEGKTFETLVSGNVYSHGEVMFRRSIYEQVGGYRPAFKNCQDFDLWLRMVKVSKLATVTENLYDRYVRFDGVSYNPKKFAVQARYFLLCQRIAKMPPEEQETQITRLAAEGPMPMIPSEDPELQDRYFKACLRSIVWGATDQAKTIAKENILSSSKRAMVTTLATTLGSPIGRPALNVLRRRLGVS